jgi:antitoxin (DNA-binding transcriptional repressor) of toxin-antitoxin stability system
VRVAAAPAPRSTPTTSASPASPPPTRITSGVVYASTTRPNRAIPIEEAENRLDELARRVEQGETIVVPRDGKPVLDLVPHKRKGGLDREGLERFKREKGIGKIVAHIPPDFDDPLPEDFLITPNADRAPGEQ